MMTNTRTAKKMNTSVVLSPKGELSNSILPDDGRKPRLTARVGSIKLNQVSFPRNEAFFFPDEEVPKHIRDTSQ